MVAVEVLAIRRTVLPQSPRLQRTKRVAMTITPETGGTSLAIPYAPQNVEHSGLVADYVSVPRPGLKENIVYSNPQRPRMKFDLTVADKKVTATTTTGVETLVRAISVITAIQAMAIKGTRVRIGYGSLESGLWFIAEMSVSSELRDPLNDEITKASVSITCIRGDDNYIGVGNGPVTGGATTTAKPVTPAATKTTLPSTTAKSVYKPSARYYIVKKGDTLFALSLKYYGNGNKWRAIADTNGIKDPRKLKIGTKLRIP